MTELETLQSKLKARKGKPGFEENVREIERRIQELEKS
jgi:exonuclease VII small subunit